MVPTRSWEGFDSGEIESPKGDNNTVAAQDAGSSGTEPGIFAFRSASIFDPAGIGFGVVISRHTALSPFHLKHSRDNCRESKGTACSRSKNYVEPHCARYHHRQRESHLRQLLWRHSLAPMVWNWRRLRIPCPIPSTTTRLGSQPRRTAGVFRSSTNAMTFPRIGPTRSSIRSVTTTSPT